MKNLFVLCCLLYSSTLFSQGSVAGFVSGENGKRLSKIDISVKDSSYSVSTDANGNYSIALNPGQYVLVFSGVGFSKKEIADVVISNTEKVPLDVVMIQRKESISGITVRSSIKKESINAIINLQKNSATIMDGISSESIKLMPAKSSADVVKRLSGVTIVDDKYIIIRGLSDRYNAPFLNGSALPSTDPDRKAFAFNIFPSNALDNIMIIKSATPDQQAEFAGGIILLNSKDVNKTNTLQFQIGTGFNNLATFQPYFSSPNGKLDFLGIDDGTRALPKSTPANFADFKSTDYANRLTWSKEFDNNWLYQFDKNRGMNRNFQFSINQKININKEIPLYIYGALSYNRSFKKETTQRTDRDNDGTINFQSNDVVDRDNVLAGGMLNLSIALNKNNKFLFKNFINQNTDRADMQRNAIKPSEDFQQKIFTNTYLANTLLSNQLIGEHTVVKFNTKIDWQLGLNTITRYQPDMRTATYQRSLQDSATTQYLSNVNNNPNIQSGGRFYSNLSETNKNGKIDATIPFKFAKDDHKCKVGVFTQNRSRTFSARRFGYVITAPISTRTDLMPGQLFANDSLGKEGLVMDEATQVSDAYTATSTNSAAYIMLENLIASKFKLAWGFRYEHFAMKLYANDGLNDRVYSRLYNNVLPSAVLTYLLNPKTNIRASASQTLSRPEFREIAPFSFFDFMTNAVLVGFDSLKQAKITNLDLRYEMYPNKGEILSASVFYKYFQNPIEQRFFSTGAGSQTRTFMNSDIGTLLGAEIEFRKSLSFLAKKETSLLNDVSIFGNFAIMESKIDYTFNKIKYTRPMQGQSSYIANFGTNFNWKKINTNISVIYNKIGERITMVGDNTEPTVWEKPRDMIDITINKSFADLYEFRFTIADLLSQDFVYYQNPIGSTKSKYSNDSEVFIRSQFGANYGLSFVYKFNKKESDKKSKAESKL
jgi:TonB-dependent receptor